MAERRHARRHKSFLRGFVRVDKAGGAMGCLIRDLSEEGARIILSESVTIPDVIDLHIPQRDQTLRAHVEWRHGDEIGLAFTAAVATADPPGDAGALTKRVVQLEAEIASLRRVLKRLKGDKPGQGETAA